MGAGGRLFPTLDNTRLATGLLAKLHRNNWRGQKAKQCLQIQVWTKRKQEERRRGCCRCGLTRTNTPGKASSATRPSLVELTSALVGKKRQRISVPSSALPQT